MVTLSRRGAKVGAWVALACLVSACGTGSDVTTVSMIPVAIATPAPQAEAQALPIDASAALPRDADAVADVSFPDVSAGDAGDIEAKRDGAAAPAIVVASAHLDGAAAAPVVVEPSNAAATVNAMARIRSFANLCYQNAVVADPDLEGKLTLDVQLTPSGQVESAEVQAVSGISNEMISCITHKVRLLNFDAAQHLKSLRVPMTFHKPQN